VCSIASHILWGFTKSTHPDEKKREREPEGGMVGSVFDQASYGLVQTVMSDLVVRGSYVVIIFYSIDNIIV